MILSRAVGVLALAAVSQAQDPFRITGAKVFNSTSIPVRRNINDLQAAGGAPWDLYLLALAQMYTVDYRDPLSFFQIAGIHGAPYQEWNNTGGPQYDGWPGYCPHGILVNIALQIAETYPPQWRQQYRIAAQTLRSPRWDWSKDSNVPPATVPATITVTVPNGNALTQKQIPNPLNSYTFPSSFRSCYGPKTVRCPAPDSYPESANKGLASSSTKEWTYDIFTQSTDFLSFASTGTDGISLESAHNFIHWHGACGQAFLAPDCAAFDPLFFMHHTHVDALYAYWEILHADQTVFPGSYRGGSRWATESGTVITAQSPLLPFFDGNGNVFTSNSVAAEITPKNMVGYTYESMESGQTPDQMKSSVATFINENYKPADDDSLNKRSTQAFKSKYMVQVIVKAEDLSQLPCNIEVCIGDVVLGSAIIMMLPKTGTMYNSFSIDNGVKTLRAKDKAASDDFPDYFKQNLEVTIKTTDGGSIDPSTVKSLEIRLEQVNVTNPQSMDQLPRVMSKVQHGSVKPLEAMSERLKAKLGRLSDFMG